jgi:alkaline phosphatase
MQNSRKIISLFILVSLTLFGCVKEVQENTARRGNVIFIHPDGTGLAGWHALRILEKGPDGELQWDKLESIGLYKSHVKNTLTTSSNAGATIHAYGKKVRYHSYGMDETEELTALSGKKQSIMMEARDAGLATGLVNSGSIIEPGTGVFMASDTKRAHYEAITKKIVESGADVILSGGEEWFLPEGVEGKHAVGRRTDGMNLVDYAKSEGYTIVYNREELLSIPADTKKLLGVLAKIHTFNDKSEEELNELGLANFDPNAPTLAEMTKVAIDVLTNSGKQFFLVVEEEGTDNFGNKNNASGFFESLSRSDEAIGVAREFAKENPNTLIIVASDSEAGGPEVIGARIDEIDETYIVPDNESNGAPVDGINGTGGKPFYSQPDQFGQKLPFYIAWSTNADTYGSVVARATGINSEMINGTIDNTDIYRVMYATLFGKTLD